MRICVYGAGAVGGHLAARLKQAGAEVSVVARGAHLAAIRERGITIRAADEAFTVRLPAEDDPARLGEQDAVLVTAKAPSLPSVAAGIGPLLGPRTAVAFIGNGIPWWYFDRHGGALDGTRLERLDPGDAVRRAVGTDRTIGGVVYSACTVLEPGVIRVAVPPASRLILGEIDGSVTSRVAAILEPMRASGFAVEASPRIRDAVWAKLIRNLAGSAASLIAQAAPKDALREPPAAAATRVGFVEAIAIARGLGCALDVDLDDAMEAMQTMLHRPSILQDLELGRPMEVDAIFDAPLRLARLAGVATPTLDLLVALIKVRARSAGLDHG